MMARMFLTIFLIICIGVEAQERDPKWAKKLNDVLQVRDSLIEKIETLKKRPLTDQNVEGFITFLENFSSQFNGIDNLDFTKVENNRKLLMQLLNQPEEPKVKKYFRSKNLTVNYTERGLGFVLKTLKGYYDYQCVQMVLSPPQTRVAERPVPFEAICTPVNEDLRGHHTSNFSIAKICINAEKCTGEKTPHPFGDRTGTSTKNACKADNSCDVLNAIPMMGALLWYKISDFIARSFCSNSLTARPFKNALKTDLKEIDTMINLMIAYSSTLNWNTFFDRAIQKNAFSNLTRAMSMFGKRGKSLEIVSFACSKLKANTDVCTVGNIYPIYVSLKKLKKDRTKPHRIRDLRVFSNINHQKMLKLQRNDLAQMNIIGNMKRNDKNLRKKLSTYFREVANYDKGIAQADVNFISKKLKQFNNSAASLTKKVGNDMKDVLQATKTALDIQVADKTINLLLTIFRDTWNPFKLLFGGGDANDKTAEFANSLQERARGKALIQNLEKVLSDTSALAKKFLNNSAQISNLTRMVNAIKRNNIDKLDTDAAKFIKAFDDYSPKVDKSDLAKNDALLSSFKDTACGLLFGMQGVLVSGVQGRVGGNLLCEKLQGTLAEFSTLRENIFDFQFNLVNALARVVRGNVANKLAKSIGSSNLLDDSKMMLGFLMTQYRLQSHASFYCNKLEYLNQGRKINECAKPGFFSKHDLTTLVAYRPDSAYHEDERFVYIPTRPQFNGDKGFIDLPALKESNTVIFRLPANRTWLRKYNWLARGEKLAPFVKSFKLYLPLKQYKTGREREFSRTQIHLKSVAGSSFDGSAKLAYYLPPKYDEYKTKYIEGYSRSQCPSGKEIDNPYSLCDNLPKICDTSQTVPQSCPSTQALRPTILSTWNLTITKGSGARDLLWGSNSPNPATNLLIIGKVQLCFTLSSNRRQFLSQQRDTGALPSKCCTDNTYRLDWKKTNCVPCPSKPTNSVSKLGGYYCEK